MPVLIAVVLALLYGYQIKREEVHLQDRFGAEYEAYVATVPRFFPSYRRYTEPDEIQVSPRLMKRGLFGIAFLLILIGALELLRGLHESGWLPVWFQIY